MLMRVGVLRGAAVIGEVYVLHRLPFTVKLSSLIILSVTTIFLTKLGMRPLRSIFRLRIPIPYHEATFDWEIYYLARESPLIFHQAGILDD